MLATVWLAGFTLLAAQPVNDNFADRIVLSGARVTTTGASVGATREPGEPAYNGVSRQSLLRTVWWSWTAPSGGVLAVSALGSDYPAVVDVATGATLSELRLASDVLASGPWHRTVRVPVSAGTAYQIVVGIDPSQGDLNIPGDFLLNLAFFERPPNDDFADRIHLGSGNVSVSGTNTAATIGPGEDQAPFQVFGRTVWWSWTASASGPVTIGLEASPLSSEDLIFDEYPGVGLSLGIYVGNSLSPATPVTNRFSRSFLGAPELSQVTFDGVAGTTYQIAADGMLGMFGGLTLRIARTQPPVVLLTRPLNGAEFVAGSPGTAVAEVLDPDGTVGAVEFYVEDRFKGTHQTARDGAPPFSSVWTNLAPGQYDLSARVTDNLGATADAFPVRFNVRPVNDAFARRIPFTGAFNMVTGMVANATSEPGEPPGTDGGSAWWAWTAPATGTFTLTAGSAAGLAVFAGASLSDLTLIASSRFQGNDGSSSTRVVIEAEVGRTYPIAVSGGGQGGLCTLSVAQTVPPTVTITSPVQDARFVVGEPVTFTATASDADGTVRRVEYVLDDYLALGVVTNSPFALVQTFTVGWMRHRVRAWATDDAGIATPSELVWFEVYYPGPPNDHFADRVAFTGSFTSVTGSTTNATSEPGEAPVPNRGSAWWAWTAPESGAFTLTVRSQPGYGPALAVFNGTALSGLNLITNSAFAGLDYTYETRVVFQAQAGVTYPIVVGSGGDIVLSVARTIPPIVSISSPTNQAVWIVGTEISIMADASDPDGAVSQVEFYLNGGLSLGVVTNRPFVLPLTITSAFYGYSRLQAWATDNHGVRTISDEVQVRIRFPGLPNDDFANRIDFTGSFVTVTGSTADATFEVGENSPLWEGSAWWTWTAPESADFTITAASQPGYRPSLAVFTGSTLAGLNLMTNNAYGGQDLTYSTRVVLRAEAGTTYPIAASSRGDISLSVARSLPPSVTLTSPADGAVLPAGQAVTLAADAADPDGTVSRVEFYLDGGRRLGAVSNSPFLLNVTLTEGTHRLCAYATDDRGLTTVSAEIGFGAQYPPPPNDDFASRIPLAGTLIVLDADVRSATREPGEPDEDPSSPAGSTWWSWTAPASGKVILTCSELNSFLGVYAGPDVTRLMALATNAPLGSSPYLVFDAVVGTEYQIGFVGYNGVQGTIRLALFLDARELLRPRMLSDDLFAFDFRTTAERLWIIEASTNLVNWTPLAEGHCADGTLEFLDPAAASHPRRFYRAVAEP